MVVVVLVVVVIVLEVCYFVMHIVRSPIFSATDFFCVICVWGHATRTPHTKFCVMGGRRLQI